jgi:flagellar biosynthesis/type III secretory pathway chaperone
MSNVNTEGLPPEMQARIAEIIEKAKANAVQPHGAAPAAPTQPGPVAAPGIQNPGALAPRPPSLMDHIIALRQEVAELRQQVQASGQVTEAVGQAVGSLYQMFQQQTEPSTYSSAFQETQPSLNDDF